MQPIISLACKYDGTIDMGEIMLMAYMCKSESYLRNNHSDICSHYSSLISGVMKI